jgi:hypothetical protein
MYKFFALLPIFVTIAYFLYLNKSKRQTIIKQNIYKNTILENKIKLLTYNIQRLPYFFRPFININHLIKKYDIICLQEDFCTNIKKEYFNEFNICKIGNNSIFKLLDSGITIYSRIPLEFIDFIPFKNLKSVDKLSDKGFLIVKYKNIYFINTHLQASYYLNNDNNNISLNQLGEIFKYLENNQINKFVIIGDFNVDLEKLRLDKYKILYTDEPTHYCKMDSIFVKSSAFPKNKYFGYKLDGCIYNNVNISNIKSHDYDQYTDHLGVSLIVNL